MKNIYLLGATGSIGLQTIEIIEENPDDFNLVAISGYNQLDELIDIASRFSLRMISVKNEEDANVLKKVFTETTIVSGDEGLKELATLNPGDKDGILVNALVGMVGLRPTIEAIQIDRTILLANKETLVVGGHLIQELLEQHKSKLYPLDSEHNAIWQALNGEDLASVKRLIITASGGAFRDLSREELKHVTLKDALNHPNWSMGQKITIDSATMMNKGFELIEAAYLFHIDMDRIQPIIHRESIIHSMVEFNDNSIIAQMAQHDMRLPISYAMYYPKRTPGLTQPLDFGTIKELHFEEVDYERYPLLGLAIEAYQQGGSKRAVLNAANEIAVSLFLENKITFLDIENIVIDAVHNHKVIPNPSLEEIIAIDKEIKTQIRFEYDR
ncbi:MAG: 1-deoxy-D-xylulose-5-phosphate reductoisomerase [Bacilli bacterium]|nr:1-deoxy-D-xylulose-5-phosphate reductoisomerase [Bacilli bacterium]MBN2877024.1 1-deoxy-D-xylulose-5-phosphate reductoisomerase [Bacilli bacterium]